MINENLWNQKGQKMSPKMRKFSSDALTFKKSPRDFAREDSEDREASFQKTMRNLLQIKRDASERQNARRLERLIV